MFNFRIHYFCKETVTAACFFGQVYRMLVNLDNDRNDIEGTSLTCMGVRAVMYAYSLLRESREVNIAHRWKTLKLQWGE